MDRNVGNVDSQFRIVVRATGGPVYCRHHRPVERRRPRRARVGAPAAMSRRCAAGHRTLHARSLVRLRPRSSEPPRSATRRVLERTAR